MLVHCTFPSLSLVAIQSLTFSLSQPFARDPSRSVVITYDDPHSLGLKGQMAAKKGIRGVLMVRSHTGSHSRVSERS